MELNDVRETVRDATRPPVWLQLVPVCPLAVTVELRPVPVFLTAC